MNLYCFSPHNPEMNFITESFWMEKSTDKVNTIDACAMKVKKLPTKPTAIFPISLAYVLPRSMICVIFCCNLDCIPATIVGSEVDCKNAFLIAPGIRCALVTISVKDCVFNISWILEMFATMISIIFAI